MDVPSHLPIEPQVFSPLLQPTNDRVENLSKLTIGIEEKDLAPELIKEELRALEEIQTERKTLPFTNLIAEVAFGALFTSLIGGAICLIAAAFVPGLNLVAALIYLGGIPGVLISLALLSWPIEQTIYNSQLSKQKDSIKTQLNGRPITSPMQTLAIAKDRLLAYSALSKQADVLSKIEQATQNLKETPTTHNVISNINTIQQLYQDYNALTTNEEEHLQPLGEINNAADLPLKALKKLRDQILTDHGKLIETHQTNISSALETFNRVHSNNSDRAACPDLQHKTIDELDHEIGIWQRLHALRPYPDIILESSASKQPSSAT